METPPGASTPLDSLSSRTLLRPNQLRAEPRQHYRVIQEVSKHGRINYAESYNRNSKEGTEQRASHHSGGALVRMRQPKSQRCYRDSERDGMNPSGNLAMEVSPIQELLRNTDYRREHQYADNFLGTRVGNEQG